MYQLKFMFEYFVGTCIWAINDEAQERFGEYIVDLNNLPISPSLKQDLSDLCKEYDTLLDWAEPQAGMVWTQEHLEDFNKRALVAYNKFKEEMDDDTIVENWINLERL